MLNHGAVFHRNAGSTPVSAHKTVALGVFKFSIGIIVLLLL